MIDGAACKVVEVIASEDAPQKSMSTLYDSV